MKRASRATVAVALLAALAAISGPESVSGRQVEQEPEWAPLTAVLRDEQLPIMHRFSIEVASLVAGIRQDLTATQSRMEVGFGLQLDASELVLLSTLYGDFDRMQQEIHHRELTRPGIQQAEIAELGRDLLLQRYEHEGRVLGEWAAQLRHNGHAMDEYLRELAFDPSYGVSRAFGGRVPTREELEHEAMVFERAFEAAYGRSLDDVLAEGTATQSGEPR